MNYTGVYHRTYPTIGKLTELNSAISGLAVQKTGSFLFIARSGLDQVMVINKKTAARIATITLDSVRALAVDKNNKLWAVTGAGMLARYNVNAATGALSMELSVTGLVKPLAISAGGNLLAVADGGASQQVKFYDISTGALSSTLGQMNGYVNKATVTDNKFFFQKKNFIAFQNDGSYWVNDPGNLRVQKYSAAGVFLDRIMSLGATYTSCIDQNNISRVFTGLL